MLEIKRTIRCNVIENMNWISHVTSVSHLCLKLSLGHYCCASSLEYDNKNRNWSRRKYMSHLHPIIVSNVFERDIDLRKYRCHGFLTCVAIDRTQDRFKDVTTRNTSDLRTFFPIFVCPLISSFFVLNKIKIKIPSIGNATHTGRRSHDSL